MDFIKNLSQLFTRSVPSTVTVGLSQATPSLFWVGESGSTISHQQALTVSAYFAALRTISEEVGAFPRHLYRKDIKLGRVELDTPLAKLLKNPNPVLYTGCTFWQTLTRHCLEYGNGYAQITKAGATPKSLTIIHPFNVEPKIQNDQLVYHVKDGQTTRILTGDQLLHVVGFSDNGLVGCSPIQYHAQILNTGKFASEFTSNFFANGANPSGVLEYGKTLSVEAGEKLRTQFASKYTGSSNTHKPMLLEDGMKFSPITVDPEKSQLIELKKYNVEDIARIFRIPLSKLQSNEKANYNSLEAENTAFVQETLLPWCRKIEEEFSRKLIPEADQGTVYCRFSVDGRARGTLAERNTAYAAGRNGGWYSANDIRELENLTRIEGGDEYLVPLNMVPASEIKTETETRSVEVVPVLDFLPLVESITRGLATKEAKALQVALKAPAAEDKRNNYNLFLADHIKLVAEKYLPPINSKLVDTYRTVSRSVFEQRIETELTTDQWINEIVSGVVAEYKGIQ